MDSRETQVLRSIDKHDKLGTAGVVALLQKSAEDFGAGLDPVRAGLIGQFLDSRGEDNNETLANLKSFLPHAARVNARLRLIVVLEGSEVAPGVTAWDRLLAMPANDDETWANDGRPKNIGWALDDIIAVARAEGARVALNEANHD